MRLLDLFCCEGGASTGYSRAGFDVYGVDLWDAYKRKRYPFPSWRGDAMEVLDRLLDGGKIAFNSGETLGLHDFAVITASPPCQPYSVTKVTHSNVHAELLKPVRTALRNTGLPYVIENVVGAPMKTPVTLCGTMFRMVAKDTDGRMLYLRRHRLFESNEWIVPKGRCRCAEFDRRGIGVGGVYGHGANDRAYAKNVKRGGYTPIKDVRSELMGVDWMTERGLSQAIPPAYTEFLGRQLIGAICPSV